MAVTLEQVEKLRDKAHVSYEEARYALEQSEGDLLEALIYLEREGKTEAQQGGFYSTCSQQDKAAQTGNTGNWQQPWKNFFESTGRFLAKMINVGGNNYLDVSRNGQHVLSISVLAFILLVAVGFWCVLPLMLIGLFFKFRYRIRGTELGNEKVNQILEKTADAIQKTEE